LDIDDNPFYMIRLMQEEDTKLKHWLDYSLNTLKRDKRERTNLNFEDYFSRFKSTWFKALQQRKIDLELIGDKKMNVLFVHLKLIWTQFSIIYYLILSMPYTDSIKILKKL
jgi:hypothetical protein